jgi:hypothetical protein
MHICPFFYGTSAAVAPILGYHDIPSMQSPSVTDYKSCLKITPRNCYQRFLLLSISAPWTKGQKVQIIRFKYRFYLYLVDCPYRLIPTLSRSSPFSTHPTYFVMNQLNIFSHKSLNVQDFPQTICMHFSSIPCVLYAPPISSST